MITHRSKVVQYQRCPRSRYWLGEKGLEREGRATPLVTGGAVHAGLATLLMGTELAYALADTRIEFEDRASEHGLTESLELLEQRSMAEALTRVAQKRIIPRLLEDYEVLEVEKPDSFPLAPEIDFHFTPDALLRRRSSGDLHVLSWKTAAYQPKEEEVRVDMQGVTEAWGTQQRLSRIKTGLEPLPKWYGEGDERVVGVQMAYLIKGRRTEIEREGQTWKRMDSPLVWAWQKDEMRVPEFHWRCLSPHPMKKSRYYPDGMCQGGRKHERGGEWHLTQIRPEEIEKWIESLPEETLDKSWAIPSPIFRPAGQMESYMQQVLFQERRIQGGMKILSQMDSAKKAFDEKEGERLEKSRERILDEVFPQNGTAVGCKFFGAICPAYEICFGPSHIALDPLGSGNYRKSEPLYQIEEAL